jgi:hypothetical protein
LTLLLLLFVRSAWRLDDPGVPDLEAERVDREHVVVSAATRNDPQLYSLALSTL